MSISTTCKGCGVVLAAEDEDALVSAVQAHLAEAHPGGHSPSREQVLAVIRARTSMSPDRETPVRGYTASKDQLANRLRRIEGQVRGVQGMVADDRYCIDVLTQISAIQAALDKVALGLLDGHAHHCVMGADSDVDRDAKTEEMMAAVGRLMRRG